MKCHDLSLKISVNFKGKINDIADSCIHNLAMWRVREADTPVLEDQLSSLDIACNESVTPTGVVGVGQENENCR